MKKQRYEIKSGRKIICNEHLKMWFYLDFYNVEYLYVAISELSRSRIDETGLSCTKVGANCSVQLNLLQVILKKLSLSFAR